ncbi:MAG: hypothetical protein P8P55_05090 [Flavobacteriaceae bacterium]|nr:hypothetical protein [Flavobacteriaceae bacterium]
MNLKNKSKTSKLFFSLCFDALGYVSLLFPFFDILWAPLSGYLMTQLFEGKKGKIAGVLIFIEEALPILDVVPTFTIMWVYTNYFDKSSKASSEVSN